LKINFPPLKSLFVFCVLSLFFSAKAQTLLPEKYRPQFHFTPPKGWMNDPNGLVFFKGEYHLFYQHYPKNTVWGPMHWGHAVSRDFLHWENLPVALYPDSLGFIFSGSVVVDKNNTSGFFHGTDGGLVAIFTHDKKGLEQQSLAYSYDNGRNWTKFAKNPVLPARPDFRDPKVFWHEPDKKWKMAVVLAAEQKVLFYEAADLKNWQLTGTFEPQGWHEKGVLWECPDLIELPIEGTNRKKWVLLVSVNQTPMGGSGMQYFAGDFDGKNFTNASPPQTVKWVDEGRDFYAGVTFNNAAEKDGARYLLGWMSNWQYATKTPTESWRSAMSVVRELRLRQKGNDLVLTQEPLDELRKLRKNHFDLNNADIRTANELLNRYKVGGKQLEIRLEVEMPTGEFEIKVRKGKNQETKIGYDRTGQMLWVNRTFSGESRFDSTFARETQTPLILESNLLILQILLDESSVEIFAGNGEKVMTFQIFPDPESKDIELLGGENVVIKNLDIWTLK
jgi:fructan beta-fructosidase